MLSQHPNRTVILLISCLMFLAGCGKSTIDKKEVSSTPPPAPTVTVPVETPTFTVPTITISPKPSPTSSPSFSIPPSPTPQSRDAAPNSVAQFLQMIGLDQSYARYVTPLPDGEGGPIIGYHIATNGQKLPEVRVPPGVVLDFSSDGFYWGSEQHSSIQWIDNQCGAVTRTQAGPQGGSFTGSMVTFYWSGWANPPAAPDWCS